MVAMARKGDVELRQIIQVAGSRAHAAGLIILSLPEALPLPVAGMSIILGILLMILVAHLALFGSGGGIPSGIAHGRLPARLVRLVAGKAIPIMVRLERMSRPRWTGLACSERPLALACVFLAFVIALPIPLSNLPPAACLLVIAPWHDAGRWASGRPGRRGHGSPCRPFVPGSGLHHSMDGRHPQQQRTRAGRRITRLPIVGVRQPRQHRTLGKTYHRQSCSAWCPRCAAAQV
jgi:hypothetical protein